MLIITLSPYQPVGNLQHYATSYYIASEPTGTNIIDSCIKSTEFLDSYPSTLKAPMDLSYYYSYKRHIRDNTTGEDIETPRSAWKEYKPVANSSALILYNEIVIDKPIILLDKTLIEEISYEVDNVVIKTTDFRCNNDNHDSTHWVVTDGLDNVIFSSLYDNVNKTSITINKDQIDFRSKSVVNIHVIHRGTSGIESDVGIMKLNVNKSNFEITSSLDRIVPYTSCRVRLNKVFNNMPLITIRYELISTKDDVAIMKKELSSEITYIDIPGEILEPASSYYLDIYSVGTNGTVISKRKLIKTIPTTNVSKDINLKFKKELTLLNTIPMTNNYAEGFVTYEDYNGLIPKPLVNNIKLFKGKFDRSINLITIDQVKFFSSVSLVSNDNKDIYSRMLDNSILLVDTYVNTTPTFFVYRYDSYNDRATLLHSMPRSTETKTIGYLNNVIIKDNLLYYVAYGTKNLIVYDIKNNTVNNVDSKLPITDVSKGINLLEVDNNRFLFIGGDSEQCFTFNIDTKQYNNAFPLPVDFRNCSLKSITLVNGDALVFRISKRPTDSEFDKVMYYDNFNNEVTYIEPDTIGGFFPTGITRLANGEVLLDFLDESFIKQYRFA